MHEGLEQFGELVDREVRRCRLRDLQWLLESEPSQRIAAIARVLRSLPTGAYLLGCGPYTTGILRLSVDEVVLGRPPSPMEELPRQVPDYTLDDAVWFIPREASRIHATILKRTSQVGDCEYLVRDEDSTTGTYLNGTLLDNREHDAHSNPALLSQGDIIWLGPSGVNSYVFMQLPASSTSLSD